MVTSPYKGKKDDKNKKKHLYMTRENKQNKNTKKNQTFKHPPKKKHKTKQNNPHTTN